MRSKAAALAAISVLFLGAIVPAMSAEANPNASSAAAGRRLVFADEFDGTRLDNTAWVPVYRWHIGKDGSRNDGNDEEQWYQSSNVTVANSRLVLRAERDRVRGERDGVPEWFSYRSGIVSGMRAFRYGYVEILARLPIDSGMWPALWLLPDDLSWPPEIDIVEAGGRLGVVKHTFHPVGQDQVQGETQLADSSGWHTYGLLWEPNQLTWTIDGEETFRTGTAIPNVDMYVVANLAVGGEFSGWVDAATRFPAQMEIEYIRVYQ